MHPINKSNFGSTGLAVTYHNGTSVVTNGYITKQLGTNKFRVTDGSNPKVVTLAPTTAIATNLASNRTYFTIPAHPASTVASGATFVAHYGVDSATIAAAGTGYTAADVLTIASGGGATITVSTVSSGAVATFTISAVGSVTALLTNPVTVTGGTGTGATFNLKWKLVSVTTSGGTGYKVGDTLVFTGIVATTQPTAHVATLTGSAAATVTLDTPGVGITTGATAIQVGAVDQHVKRIYDTHLTTTEGNQYGWTRNSTVCRIRA